MGMDILDAENVSKHIKGLLGEMLIPQTAVSTFDDDDSFMDTGILDSTGVLELVGHIEKNMGIRIESDEIIPDNLDSINRLVSFILKKKANAAANSSELI